MHHPESHGAPVHDHKDAKVDVEEGSKEGEREHTGGDGEEAPEEVQQRPAVTHAALVVARVSEQFVVGGQNPGKRQEGGKGGDACRETQRRMISMLLLFRISTTSLWLTGGCFV